MLNKNDLLSSPFFLSSLRGQVRSIKHQNGLYIEMQQHVDTFQDIIDVSETSKK